MYIELVELREFKSCIEGEMGKLKKVLSIEDSCEGVSA